MWGGDAPVFALSPTNLHPHSLKACVVDRTSKVGHLQPTQPQRLAPMEILSLVSRSIYRFCILLAV